MEFRKHWRPLLIAGVSLAGITLAIIIYYTCFREDIDTNNKSTEVSSKHNSNRQQRQNEGERKKVEHSEVKSKSDASDAIPKKAQQKETQPEKEKANEHKKQTKEEVKPIDANSEKSQQKELQNVNGKEQNNNKNQAKESEKPSAENTKDSVETSNKALGTNSKTVSQDGYTKNANHKNDEVQKNEKKANCKNCGTTIIIPKQAEVEDSDILSIIKHPASTKAQNTIGEIESKTTAVAHKKQDASPMQGNIEKPNDKNNNSQKQNGKILIGDAQTKDVGKIIKQNKQTVNVCFDDHKSQKDKQNYIEREKSKFETQNPNKDNQNDFERGNEKSIAAVQNLSDIQNFFGMQVLKNELGDDKVNSTKDKQGRTNIGFDNKCPAEQYKCENSFFSGRTPKFHSPNYCDPTIEVFLTLIQIYEPLFEWLRANPPSYDCFENVLLKHYTTIKKSDSESIDIDSVALNIHICLRGRSCSLFTRDEKHVKHLLMWFLGCFEKVLISRESQPNRSNLIFPEIRRKIRDESGCEYYVRQISPIQHCYLSSEHDSIYDLLTESLHLSESVESWPLPWYNKLEGPEFIYGKYITLNMPWYKGSGEAGSISNEKLRNLLPFSFDNKRGKKYKLKVVVIQKMSLYDLGISGTKWSYQVKNSRFYIVTGDSHDLHIPTYKVYENIRKGDVIAVYETIDE